MLCSHCGTGHSGVARFCGKCGALLPSGLRQKTTQPSLRVLSGTPRRLSVRGYTAKARTLRAERLKAKYQRLGWIFIQRDEVTRFSSELPFLAPIAPERPRASGPPGVGVALVGVLSVAVLGLSGGSSTLGQIFEERQQLLPRAEQPQRDRVVEAITTSIAPMPALTMPPSRHGSRTTREREAVPRIPIIIASDPEAEYFVIERTTSRNKPTLVVERVGPSGVTYSERLFDCRRHEFKYLGGGDTLAALELPAPPREMVLLFEGSISDYWWHHTCRKPKQARR